MDFRLNEQEGMLQEVARRFADRMVRPLALDLERGAPFPHDMVQQAGRLGYLGLPYPRSLGGADVGYQGLGLVVEQLAEASMAMAAIVSVHHLATETLFRFGTEEQQARLLLPLASGGGLGCFSFTEAATGSNPAEITTTATKTGKGWTINGQKAFISLGTVASLCIVFAQVESSGLGAFAVELPAAGFEFGPILEMMGGKGLPTAPAVLTDVFVSDRNRLGEPGQGFDILLDVITTGKLCVAHQAVGIAQRALDLARDYASQRQSHGASIDQLPSIQSLMAEMAVRVESARWLAYRCMAAWGDGSGSRYDAALAKLYCSRAAVETTSMAMQVHGAYGYLETSEISRLYKDAKLTEIYEGVSEIQQAIIANRLLRPARQ